MTPCIVAFGQPFSLLCDSQLICHTHDPEDEQSLAERVSEKVKGSSICVTFSNMQILGLVSAVHGQTIEGSLLFLYDRKQIMKTSIYVHYAAQDWSPGVLQTVSCTLSPFDFAIDEVFTIGSGAAGQNKTIISNAWRQSRMKTMI